MFVDLNEMLTYQNEKQPNADAYIFINEKDTTLNETISYANLLQKVQAIAATLQNELSPGATALLLYQPGIEFIAAFYACMLANIIAVPVYLPRAEAGREYLSHLKNIIKDAKISALLTCTNFLNRDDTIIKYSEHSLLILTTDTISVNNNKKWFKPEIDPKQIAFLQYTSGSLAKPKGVMLSHENLLANLYHISQSFRMNQNSKGVIWLPPYHDMGLIGGILAPMYNGFPVILMSPYTFIKNPISWLKMISHHKASISGGPNFAFELCIKRVLARPVENLDLSSWEVAFCGAEPIHAETINNFTKTFSPYGFRAQAFQPCYGLAENSLLVSTKQNESLAKVTYFSTNNLRNNKAIEVNNDNSNQSQALVSCGEIIPNHELQIINPKTRVPLDSGKVGEIWLRGSSVAMGYFNNPIKTKKIFGGCIKGQPEKWLKTGDLGFIYQNELYITGRRKELIIAYGKNYYPQDIEQAAKSADNNLCRAAAVFIDKQLNQEQIILVQEVNKSHTYIDYEQLIIRIKQAILAKLALAINKLLLVKAGSIPRTTSGKIQRLLCHKLYLNHQLPIVYTHKISGDNPATYLQNKISALTGIAPSKINFEQKFNELGLDSIQIIELKNSFEEYFNCYLEIDDFSDNHTINYFIQKLSLCKSDLIISHSSQITKLPISTGQKEIAFAQILNPNSNAYHLSRVFKLLGNVNVDLFAAAIKRLVARHANLRSTFHKENEHIMQNIHPDLIAGTLNIYTSVTDENKINELLQVHSQKSFDFSNEALIKFHIYKISTAETIILFSAHHLIVDLWSINLIFTELESLYECLSANQPLPNYISSSPEDYINWYSHYLISDQYQFAANFWIEHLANYPTPVTYPSVNENTKQTKVFYFTISEMDRQIINMLARENRVSAYSLMLCIFQILLFEYSGQSDIIIGTPVALRNWRGAGKYCGYCVNILPIRIDLADDPQITILMKKVHALTRDIITHGAFPFTDLINHFMPERRNNQIPFFNTLFIYQNNHLKNKHNIAEFALNKPQVQGKLFDFDAQAITLPTAEILTDLNFTVTPATEGFACSIEYQAEKFNEDDIEVMAKKYLRLIKKLKFSQHVKLSEFAHFPPAIQLATNKNFLPKQSQYTNYFNGIDYSQWEIISNNLVKSDIDESVFLTTVFAKVLNYWNSGNPFAFLMNSVSQEGHTTTCKIITNQLIEIAAKCHDKNIAETIDELSQQIHSPDLGITLKNDDLCNYLNNTWQSNSLAKHFPIIFNVIKQNDIALQMQPFTTNQKTYLECYIWISHSQFNIQWSYPEKLYPPKYIEAISNAFISTLKNIAIDFNTINKDINLLPKSQQRDRTLFNSTHTQRVTPQRLEKLFLRSASIFPNNIAIATKDLQITYDELQHHVCRLSHYLLSMPYQKSKPTAILMEKSWEQVAGCLGAMCAGFAYLPISANLPINQIEEILKISKVELILTHSDLITKLSPLSCDILQLNTAFSTDLLKYSEQPPVTQFQTDELAYIIFTSGSTGTPKGVMIDHASAYNTIHDINTRFKITSQDKILGLSHLNFDLSVYDIFGTFATGATLVLPDEIHLKNPAHWLALINQYHITLWNSVPLLLQMLLEHCEKVNINSHNPLHPLRLCLLSGDWVPQHLWEKLQQFHSLKVISLGGATECSIWSNFYEEKTALSNWDSVPYGIPLANQQLHIYDKSFNPCPDWVTGDLYIGGLGVARGYWQDSEKTNAAFIIHPKTRERIYRTGDLARYREGVIEFIGRNDGQIKLNGLRIEVNEIQLTLKKHPAIKDAIVMPRKHQNSDVLVAYIIVDPSITEFPLMQIDRTQLLKNYLSSYLQEYKIPKIFMYLNSFPLSINGKLSKELLPEPEFSRLNPKNSIISNNNKHQITLSHLWKNILSVEVKYSDDNFFELGGNSLLAVRLAHQINTTFNIQIDVLSIFQNQTIEKLTNFIKQAPEAESLTILRSLPRVLHKFETPM